MRKRPLSNNEPSDESIFYTKTATIRITERPKATARLYRGNTAIQQEVLAKGLLLHQDGGDAYPIRFVHDRTLREALRLRPGQVICVTKGAFRQVHGRREMEFHIKQFSLSEPKMDV
jgi:hypothetical protein